MPIVGESGDISVSLSSARALTFSALSNMIYSNVMIIVVFIKIRKISIILASSSSPSSISRFRIGDVIAA